MASRAFLQGVRAIVKGDVDFDTATLKVMLMATAPSTTNLSAWTGVTWGTAPAGGEFPITYSSAAEFVV